MKRTITIIALAVAMCGSLMAQDTVLLSGPKPNYMKAASWPIHRGDTMTHIWIGCAMKGYYSNCGQDTIPIYGIAASLCPTIGFIDSTLKENVAAMVLLKWCTTDSMVFQMGENLDVSSTDPPTYMMMLDAVLEHGYEQFSPNPVYPVYERYYERPVMVADSFYVGIKQNIGPYEHGLERKILDHSLFWRRNGQIFFNIPNIGYQYGNWEGDSLMAHWNYQLTSTGYPFIFPILTPRPEATVATSDTVGVISDTLLVNNTLVVVTDTIVTRDTLVMGGDTVVYNGDTIVSDVDTVVRFDTIVTCDTLSVHDFTVGSDTVALGDTLVVTDTVVFGSDTIILSDTLLSIMPGELLQRLTGVVPNPAGATTRVVSSVGLTGVEVYSLAGRLVYTRRLAEIPLTATVDVSRWSAGTYIVRIHTPQGTATKKLTVSR